MLYNKTDNITQYNMKNNCRNTKNCRKNFKKKNQRKDIDIHTR